MVASPAAAPPAEADAGGRRRCGADVGGLKAWGPQEPVRDGPAVQRPLRSAGHGGLGDHPGRDPCRPGPDVSPGAMATPASVSCEAPAMCSPAALRAGSPPVPPGRRLPPRDGQLPTHGRWRGRGTVGPLERATVPPRDEAPPLPSLYPPPAHTVLRDIELPWATMPRVCEAGPVTRSNAPGRDSGSRPRRAPDGLRTLVMHWSILPSLPGHPDSRVHTVCNLQYGESR